MFNETSPSGRGLGDFPPSGISDLTFGFLNPYDTGSGGTQPVTTADFCAWDPTICSGGGTPSAPVSDGSGGDTSGGDGTDWTQILTRGVATLPASIAAALGHPYGSYPGSPYGSYPAPAARYSQYPAGYNPSSGLFGGNLGFGPAGASGSIGSGAIVFGGLALLAIVLMGKR